MSKKYRYRLAITTFSAIVFFFLFELTRNNPPQKNRKLPNQRNTLTIKNTISR